MNDVTNLTAQDYIFYINIWFQRNRQKHINKWSVFEKARRWRW